MNELNVKLQGKDQFVHEVYTRFRASKTNLALFLKQMSNKSCAHVPKLPTLEEVRGEKIQEITGLPAWRILLLSDEHLRSILRSVTTKPTPDFNALAKKGDQQHCSR